MYVCDRNFHLNLYSIFVNFDSPLFYQNYYNVQHVHATLLFGFICYIILHRIFLLPKNLWNRIEESRAN